MDLRRRDYVLKKSLATNDKETLQWKKFEEENNQACANMEQFIRKLNTEIMVPIGSKALFPGYLYHANEILAGHYYEIFSKCSMSDARKIIQIRLELAERRLRTLYKEKEMFQKKLDIPHTDGVLPDEYHFEIIEEYDEEEEKCWRESHKRRIGEYKCKEKHNRSSDKDDKIYEDVIQVLDQLELIEELGEELEKLENDNSDGSKILMSSEFKSPKEKQRICHANLKSDVNSNEHLNCMLEKTYILTENCEKNKNSTQINDFTNNISDLIKKRNDQFNEDISESIITIERKLSNISSKNKLYYMKKELQKTQENLNMKIVEPGDYVQKLSLLELEEYLKDKIELLEDEISTNKDINLNSEEGGNVSKKKISFSTQDEIMYVDDDEFDDNCKKDISILDPEIHVKEKFKNLSISTNIDKNLIMSRVEKNYDFLKKSQIQKDLNLVKINSYSDSTNSMNSTHSENNFNNYFDETISSSTNISGKSENSSKHQQSDNIFVESCQTENESDKERNEYICSIHLNQGNHESGKQCLNNVSLKMPGQSTKSILKNKEATKFEIRLNEETNKKVAKSVDNSNKTMLGEVVENPLEDIRKSIASQHKKFSAPRRKISQFKKLKIQP